MKVAIVALKKQLIEKQAREVGLQIVSKNPDAVIAYGGDGTSLVASHKYPTVPRLHIHHNRSSKTYKTPNFKKILTQLSEGKFKIKEELKLKATINNNPRKTFVALNDINIHYIPPTALRLTVYSKTFKIEAIGDGVVIATPHGATAYYKSITGKTFNKGIGIALNNPTKKIRSRVLPENSKVRVKITRGPGILAADCHPRLIPLNANDIVTVEKTKEKAKLIVLNNRGEKIKNY